MTLPFLRGVGEGQRAQKLRMQRHRFSSLNVAFTQKVRFVFQISKKKLFQITILSLKFEFVVYCYWREI